MEHLLGVEIGRGVALRVGGTSNWAAGHCYNNNYYSD